MKKINIIIVFLLVTAITIYCGKAFAVAIANSNPYNDSYSAPCYINPNSLKYCNGSYGNYFFDEGTGKFWMYLTRINPRTNYILDYTYAEYNPATKKVNWNTPIQMSVHLSKMMAISAALGGQKYFYSVNGPVKTVAQIKAEKQREIENAKKAKQAKIEAEQKRLEKIKIEHQQALTKAKEDGTLPTCKKLYWKMYFSLDYVYSYDNPQPYKNVEGTSMSYCQMKDGSTAMLEFADTKDVQSGNTYRAPKLMDFTGKTKYYPWN